MGSSWEELLPPDFLWSWLAAPDFLHAAQDSAACAPFCKERRMKSGNAFKLHKEIRGLAKFMRSRPAGNPRLVVFSAGVQEIRGATSQADRQDKNRSPVHSKAAWSELQTGIERRESAIRDFAAVAAG
jgi:hypothetical protein